MVPLLAVPELQPVLHRSQEFVGAGQQVEVVTGDVSFVVQLLERKQSAAAAEPGFDSSVDALKTLHEEFNLPYSAGIRLDVDGLGTASLQLRAAVLFVLLAAGDKRRFDGGEIQFASIHQWLYGSNELAGKSAVSGGVSDFNEGLQFPILRSL